MGTVKLSSCRNTVLSSYLENVKLSDCLCIFCNFSYFPHSMTSTYVRNNSAQLLLFFRQQIELNDP